MTRTIVHLYVGNECLPANFVLNSESTKKMCLALSLSLSLSLCLLENFTFFPNF